jgi:hypothetical protein
MESYLVGNVVEFLPANVLEPFASRVELLVDPDRLLGHEPVSFLRATSQDKIGSSGQALVPIGIEANPQQECFALRFLLANIRHRRTVKVGGAEVNPAEIQPTRQILTSFLSRESH